MWRLSKYLNRKHCACLSISFIFRLCTPLLLEQILQKFLVLYIQRDFESGCKVWEIVSDSFLYGESFNTWHVNWRRNCSSSGRGKWQSVEELKHNDDRELFMMTEASWTILNRWYLCVFVVWKIVTFPLMIISFALLES